MKIRVERRDGSMETITLVPPVVIHDSPYDVPPGVGILTSIHCGDGTDHYFTFDSGHYDGWGRGCCAETLEQAQAIIENVEAGREIEPG